MSTYSEQKYRSSKKRYRQERNSRLLFVIICAVAALAFGTFCFNNISSQVKASDVSFMNTSGSFSKDSWSLLVVNAENALPENYKAKLAELSGGVKVDERISAQLQQMLVDARADGVYPEIKSGYRTAAEQKKMMSDKVEFYKNNGYYSIHAKLKASKCVAKVNHSEHQTGLAVDIGADTERSTNNEVYEWLSLNGYKYGFILRYPENKQDITGIEYEPGHYRYVGIAAAKNIYAENLCLEEYISVMG